jgi:hypothetical protein
MNEILDSSFTSQSSVDSMMSMSIDDAKFPPWRRDASPLLLLTLGPNPHSRSRLNYVGALKTSTLSYKDEFKDPVVWFTLAIATDVEPKDLVSCVIHEWHRIGGVCLTIKDLQSFKSETILSCFNVFMQTNKSVLLTELEDILTQAQTRAQEIDPTKFWWSANKTFKNSSLPPIELCLQNPKLPGQDTSHYNKLSWRVQVNRKVLQVECDKKFANRIKCLMHYAKECSLVEEFWGRHAHISKVVNKESSPSKIKILIKVAQRHISCQCSMMLEDISGIVYLNGTAAVMKLPEK